MNDSANTLNPTVDLPAGLMPAWERRFPGRFQFELDELRSRGIEPDIDLDRLKAGRLVLAFDWPLDADTTLRLRAAYPDAFPHLRPQVFLLTGLDPPPVRHRSPMEGNLCLLGRDTGQWPPSWSLHKLLAEQLEDTVRGTGEEDPQGEPAEYWWNALNRSGSFCLVDSAWDLGSARQGTLSLRYVSHAARGVSAEAQVPIIHALVAEVRAEDGAVVHQWESALPPELADAKRTAIIPWVRVDQTLLPEPEFARQVERLRQDHDWLQQSKPWTVQPGIAADVCAIVHPIELSIGETGLGWILLVAIGQRKAFHPRGGDKRGKKRRKPVSLTTLPVYRAGLRDIGYRVPAVALLRSKRVLVAGLGAIGGPIAIELARNQCGVLHLLEQDVVEPGNTVRWPLGASAWGRLKPDALDRFLRENYPVTDVRLHRHTLGQVEVSGAGLGDDDVLDRVLSEVDLVIDATTSFGVARLLGERCRSAKVPLICTFATPSVEGGAVVRHLGAGGCPTCLEYAWHRNELVPPPGREDDGVLVQPPGCGERTFIGASYDLQELALQAVRLAVETLACDDGGEPIVQTLSFIDSNGERCPPQWRVDPLPKHPECRCST